MFRVNNLIGFGARGRGKIQFVGSAIAAKASASSSTISLSSGLTGGIGEAAEAGDLVVGFFSVASTSDRDLSITDGTTEYDLIGSELYANSTIDSNLRVARKFMGSSPDASTTFGTTGGTGNGGQMMVFVFRGVDQASPLDVAAVTATGTTGPDPNPPAITPETPGALIVCCGIGAHQGASWIFDDPSDLTNFRTIAMNATNDGTLGVGLKTDWVAGPFNPELWDINPAGGSSWAAMSFALRPALF